MTSERWKQIKTIFQTAADLSPAERPGYLDEVCAGEPDLRREVEQLLAASEEAGDFIETPALHHNAATVAGATAASRITESGEFDPIVGTRVGPYRVTGRIGSGGMGAVYRAVRDDDHFRQQVAIKIVKRGMDTDFILRRFRNERQILASLEHPNIARLFDGGATEDGRPYYVMEHIEGRPIDEYCDTRRLSTADRLKLYLQVCSAVHYAHQKMVVHRDIKPSNILITSEGAPKLLDFGIAKILDPDLTDQSGSPTVTETALRMMTPAYASPEQIRGETITPASDVYSLGVLLYELLTGHRPYKFKSRAPHEMAQVICEQEPDRPSTVIGRTEEITISGPNGVTKVALTPEMVSATRDGEPKKLKQVLEGDLDAIVLMAMRKEPERRYETAQEFANDLRRYLEYRPVRARGETLGYRLGKWISRRKLATAAVAAAAFTIAAFLGWQAATRRQPQVASVKMRPTVAVLGFRNLSGQPQSEWISTALTELLGTELAAGEYVRPVSGEVIEQVKRTLRLAEADSYSRETLTRIRGGSGADYVLVGSYLFTGPGQPISLDLRLQDAVAGDTVAAIRETGRSADELPQLAARAGAQLRERLGAGGISGSDLDRARATNPANAEATRYYSEGIHRLRIFDTVAAKEFLEKAAAADPNHALTQSALALALSSLGDDARATEAAKRAFDRSKDLPREIRLFVEGRYYETINDWEKAATIYNALYGFYPDSVDYGLRLAAARINQGLGAEALQTLDALRKLPPPSSEDPRIDIEEASAAEMVSEYKRVLAAAARASAKGTAQGSRILVARAKLLEGRAYAALGQPAKAIESLDESRKLYEQFDHKRGMARAINSLAEAKVQLGDPEGARKLHEQSLAIFRSIGNQTGIGGSLHSIAVILEQQAQFDEARKLFAEALAIFRATGDSVRTAITLDGIGNTMFAQGQLAQAKDAYTEALTIARGTGDKRLVARVLGDLARNTRNAGELRSAKEMYQESIALRRQVGDETGVASALQGLAQLLLDEGAGLTDAKQMALEAEAIHRRQGAKRAHSFALSRLGQIALAEDELDAAGNYYSESLKLREGIGDKNLEAQSRLLLAQWNLEQGHTDLAEMFSKQAIAEFSRQKTNHLEALTQSTLALIHATRGKSADARRAAARASALQSQHEFRILKMSAAINLARVSALTGQRAAALKTLEGLLFEALRYELLPHQLEIRLAQAEIQAQSGDPSVRARLEALVKDATSRGYRLIARKARGLLG